jgi:hypothetical protein
MRLAARISAVFRNHLALRSLFLQQGGAANVELFAVSGVVVEGTNARS